MIDPRIPDRVATCGGTPHARTMPTTKEFIVDADRISAHILWTTGHVIRTVRDGTTARDGNIAARSPQENGPVLIGGTTIFPTCGIMGSQEILSKHGSTGSVEIGDTQKLDTSVDGNLAKNGDSTPTFSKVIGIKISHDSSTNIYLLCRADFTSNTVETEAPDSMHL